MRAMTVDGVLLRELAPVQSGSRAERQNEIMDGMGPSMTETLQTYEINTPLRIAHFLAQIAHESDGFCTTEEYASGAAYEMRADLGNVRAGDGVLFKGRGLLQLTGRSNYATFGTMLQLDLVGNPHSVNNPFVYLLVSCAFWQHKSLNSLADQDDLMAITLRVNGGTNGLDSRRAYLAKARALIAARAARDAVSAQAGAALPPLCRGAQGDGVAALQRLLRAQGYPVGVDGDFGAATELALSHFQAAKGLAADGIAGPQTMAKLQAPG